MIDPNAQFDHASLLSYILKYIPLNCQVHVLKGIRSQPTLVRPPRPSLQTYLLPLQASMLTGPTWMLSLWRIPFCQMAATYLDIKN